MLNRILFLCATCVFILTGCGSAGKLSIENRHQSLYDIAIRGGFVQDNIKTTPFILRGYKRFDNTQSKEAVLYIEGDGLAWLSRSRPSLDPTPTDPVALRLASFDRSDNVFYLARPCQYEKWIYKKTCPMKYWTSHRFDQIVIDSYMQALDTIKRENDIEGFHIVGFSGGGSVAALLAARRDDILSLRTVAGNIDHDVLNRHHNVTLMPKSLNPADYTGELRDMPQIHYSGGQDKIVPPFLAENFIHDLQPSNCASQIIIDYASHEEGWTSAWNEYHADIPKCSE